MIAEGLKPGRLTAGLARRLDLRLPALLRRRQDEALPIVLHRRRLYVLPTAFGLFFGLVFGVMQLGALNYNNNPALLFTFLLGSAGFVSVFRGFRNINGLTVERLQALPCHAGEDLTLRVYARCRAGEGQRIVLAGSHGSHSLDADADGRLVWTLQVATRHRGWLPAGDMSLASTWPLGLFRIWSWIRPDWRALVYPTPEALPPPLPESGQQSARADARPGQEDLRALRAYQPGDPPSRVAWKASARTDTLIVRELEQPRGRQVLLDWHALGGLDREQRISRLTAWVLRARRSGLSWELRLPAEHFGPDLGDAHAQRCLRALALLPDRG